MYHRYLPTANGQYRRQTVPDRRVTAPPPPKPSAQPPKSVPVSDASETAPIADAVSHTPAQNAPTVTPSPQQTCGKSAPEHGGHAPKQERKGLSGAPTALLERLFPNFDSGDLLLLFVLILLLSEGNEDSSPTILTLALSLFMQ